MTILTDRQTDRQTDRIVSLQALRALAFFAIFASHCNADWGYWGPWGVSIFIVLSGFLMAQSYKEKPLPRSIKEAALFSVNKLKKLYPLHIFMMIASLPFVIVLLFKGDFFKELMKLCIQIIMNTFLVQSWFPKSIAYFSLNGVAWYLPVCLFVYFMFPFVYSGLKELKMNQILICAIFVYILQIVVALGASFLNVPEALSDNFVKWVTYICPLYRFGDFVIGICLGLAYLNRKKYSSRVFSVIALLVVVLTVGTYYVYTNSVGMLGSEAVRYCLLFTPISVILIWIFAVNTDIISNRTASKPLIYIGNISASLFLIHQLVIRYIDVISSRIFHVNINLDIKIVLAFVLSVICAEIWNRFFMIYMNSRKSV